MQLRRRRVVHHFARHNGLYTGIFLGRLFLLQQIVRVVDQFVCIVAPRGFLVG